MSESTTDSTCAACGASGEGLRARATPDGGKWFCAPCDDRGPAYRMREPRVSGLGRAPSCIVAPEITLRHAAMTTDSWTRCACQWCNDADEIVPAERMLESSGPFTVACVHALAIRVIELESRLRQISDVARAKLRSMRRP
jgi:hypothetical protein